jgi:hypothetical protein
MVMYGQACDHVDHDQPRLGQVAPAERAARSR